MRGVYINTDLDIRARFDLAELHAELVAAGLDRLSREPRGGTWRATYETDRQHEHPADAIKQMLEVIEGLSAHGRQLWDPCVSRRFNVGYGLLR